LDEGGISALTTFANEFIYSSYAAVIVALVVGILIGNQLTPIRFLRKQARKATQDWPQVKTWLSPTQAIDVFTPQALIEQFNSANAELEKKAARRYWRARKWLDFYGIWKGIPRTAARL
jgi:uncharacterized membrane-anchored protein YhcB (DUF1043 family)